jgi:hypothetical protein
MKVIVPSNWSVKFGRTLWVQPPNFGWFEEAVTIKVGPGAIEVAAVIVTGSALEHSVQEWATISVVAQAIAGGYTEPAITESMGVAQE